MGKKFSIEFEGFDKVIARLSKLDGNVKKTTEKALEKIHDFVTEQAEVGIRPHKFTGATEKSIYKDAKVKWAGSTASIDAGFSVKKGGIASIFLMYGTPRMKKDQKLYNAFFSKKTRDEIIKIQEDIFYEEIRRLNG